MPITIPRLALWGIATFAIGTLAFGGVYGGLMGSYFDTADLERNEITFADGVAVIELKPYCGPGANLGWMLTAIGLLFATLALNITVGLMIRLKEKSNWWWCGYYCVVVVDTVLVILMLFEFFGGPEENCFDRVVRSVPEWVYSGPTGWQDIIFYRFAHCGPNQLPFRFVGSPTGSNSVYEPGTIYCHAFTVTRWWNNQTRILSFNIACLGMFFFMTGLVTAFTLAVRRLPRVSLGFPPE